MKKDEKEQIVSAFKHATTKYAYNQAAAMDGFKKDNVKDVDIAYVNGLFTALGYCAVRLLNEKEYYEIKQEAWQRGYDLYNARKGESK